jgi:hypothetical protein
MSSPTLFLRVGAPALEVAGASAFVVTEIFFGGLAIVKTHEVRRRRAQAPG